jgi:hypothetical protein
VWAIQIPSKTTNAAERRISAIFFMARNTSNLPWPETRLSSRWERVLRFPNYMGSIRTF